MVHVAFTPAHISFKVLYMGLCVFRTCAKKSHTHTQRDLQTLKHSQKSPTHTSRHSTAVFGKIREKEPYIFAKETYIYTRTHLIQRPLVSFNGLLANCTRTFTVSKYGLNQIALSFITIRWHFCGNVWLFCGNIRLL